MYYESWKNNEHMKKEQSTLSMIVGISLAAIVVTGLAILVMWGLPQYNVYQQRKAGEAALAHAQSSKEVAVAEAKAKLESSALLAQADTIRAHGIARSNQIIGSSLTDPYLHWFWIDNIDKSNNVIYVPTEANLPILEAGKWSKGNLYPEDKK